MKSKAPVQSAGKSSVPHAGESPSEKIDARIASLGGWRGKTLARMRKLVLEAAPGTVEEWKWMGTPVWENHGIICTGESYTKVVKLTFANGAQLPDPARLFNSSLEGNVRRAIDIHEGEELDPSAFQTLVRAAIARNVLAKAPKAKAPKTSAADEAKVASKSPKASAADAAPKAKAKKASPADDAKPASKSPKAIGAEAAPKVKAVSKATKATKASAGKEDSPAKGVKMLAGGNPQIAKGDGEAPVQAYIAALSGWKQEVARAIDAAVVAAVPGVTKAVKWNSPFYGVPGNGWFLSVHAFSRYVKVAFFKGGELSPLPPGESTRDTTRYLDVYEAGIPDKKQLTAWIKQAAAMPGWLA